jgi:Na+-driven multidrug efflux pump
MPMVGFNEGAGLHKRLMETVNVAVKISFTFSVAAFLLFELFAPSILEFFTNDAELLEIAVPALRIFVSMLLFIGPTLMWINMFIGLGKGFTSMVLLMMRDAILLIPMLILLPSIFGLNGVWMAQPISNIVSFFIILFWTRREFRMMETKVQAP